MQLVKQVIFQARLRADDPAVATVNAVISYRTLVRSIEAALVALGPLQRTGLVVIDVAHPLHHLYLMLALQLLGVTTASLPGRGEPLPDTGAAPALLLTDGERGGSGVPVRQVEAHWFASDPQRQPDYARLLALPEPPADTILRCVYSSGTTGRRKCIGYSNELMDERTRNTMFFTGGRAAPYGSSLSLMDFSTVAGSVAPLRVLSRGGLLCMALTPQAAVDLVRLFNVEDLNASVGQAQTLLGLLRGHAPLSSLRTLILSGSRLPLPLLIEIRARLCPDVIFAYGSTELGYISLATGGALERPEGSVGYVLPGITLEIVDAAGQPLAAGEDGLLRVRPKWLAPYIGADGERLAPPADGWFYPGDIARLAPDGTLMISGRSGDVINRGGVIIAPEVIEEAFQADPRIRDVAAVGVSGRGGIDEIWVALVTDAPLDLAALQATMVGRLHEKAPNRLFRVAALPRTGNRKLQRAQLRQQLEALAAQP